MAPMSLPDRHPGHPAQGAAGQVGTEATPATEHRRLWAWWVEVDRPSPKDPDVQRLAAAIAPGSEATDLGGVMSLNLRLEPAGLVLRVHQRFVSRWRLLAVQEVRRRLTGMGLTVAVPVPWRGATVFRCGHCWAELDAYLPNERPAPTPAAHTWLFGAMGTLHRALALLDVPVPRPPVATYAPPGTLRRWLRVTEAAVRRDPEAAAVARLAHDLTSRLRRRWVPEARMPTQLVHGDIRLSNVRRTLDGTTLYLDFGFLATRPRIHDLAYALAFMVRGPDGTASPERFPWQQVPRLLEAYEAAANSRLTTPERQALAAYTAAVPLYRTALRGVSNDPAGLIRASAPFLRLSTWLLDHPEVILG